MSQPLGRFWVAWVQPPPPLRKNRRRVGEGCGCTQASFWATHVNRKWTLIFAILGRGFDQIFGQIFYLKEKTCLRHIVPMREKTLGNTPSCHIERGNHLFPFDVRRWTTSLFKLPIKLFLRDIPGRGYSIYPWVGRCGPAPHTLTLFKTKIADFPTLFKTEFWFLIPCLRHLTRNHTLCKTIIYKNFVVV